MATDREHGGRGGDVVSSEHMQNLDAGYERSDVNARGILGFGAGLAMCVVLVCLVLYGIFSLLRKGFTGAPVNVNALVGTREPAAPSAAAAAKIFPEPRLQVNYFSDLAKIRADWDEHLNTYGWVDKNAGVVHIPIERAMQLVVERGLPTRAPGAAATAGAPEPIAGKPGANTPNNPEAKSPGKTTAGRTR